MVSLKYFLEQKEKNKNISQSTDKDKKQPAPNNNDQQQNKQKQQEPPTDGMKTTGNIISLEVPGIPKPKLIVDKTMYDAVAKDMSQNPGEFLRGRDGGIYFVKRDHISKYKAKEVPAGTQKTDIKVAADNQPKADPIHTSQPPTTTSTSDASNTNVISKDKQVHDFILKDMSKEDMKKYGSIIGKKPEFTGVQSTTANSKGQYIYEKGSIKASKQSAEESGIKLSENPNMNTNEGRRSDFAAETLKDKKNKLFLYEKDGETVLSDTFEHQLLYLENNNTNMFDVISNEKYQFENEESKLALIHISAVLNKSIAKLKKLGSSATKEERASISMEFLQGYSDALTISDRKPGSYSASLLKNMAEFVEHNRELIEGNENYLPASESFPTGDKLEIGRNNKGLIIRIEATSFKSNSKAPAETLDIAGASPAARKEVYACTFFKDKEKDKEFKDEFAELFGQKEQRESDSKKLKTDIFSMVKKHFSTDFEKIKKEVEDKIKDPEEPINKQIEIIDKMIKKCDNQKVLKRLEWAKEELKKYQIKSLIVEPLFNKSLSSNFKTIVFARDRINKRMYSGENNDGADSYKASTKPYVSKLTELNKKFEEADKSESLDDFFNELNQSKKISFENEFFKMANVCVQPMYNIQRKNMKIFENRNASISN